MSLLLSCYYYYLYYRTSTAINDEKRYDTNVQYTVDCINTAGNINIYIIIIINVVLLADNSKEAICATKITGLGRTEVLVSYNVIYSTKVFYLMS